MKFKLAILSTQSVTDFHMEKINPMNFVLAIFIGSLFLGLATGCIGPDPENKSAQPWNKQRPWEHGIPGGITERR